MGAEEKRLAHDIYKRAGTILRFEKGQLLSRPELGSYTFSALAETLDDIHGVVRDLQHAGVELVPAAHLKPLVPQMERIETALTQLSNWNPAGMPRPEEDHKARIEIVRAILPDLFRSSGVVLAYAAAKNPALRDDHQLPRASALSASVVSLTRCSRGSGAPR